MGNRPTAENSVPVCCWSCPFFEAHEYDDMGYLWANAFCYRGLFLPTRKQTCKVKDRALSAATAEKEDDRTWPS